MNLKSEIILWIKEQSKKFPSNTLFVEGPRLAVEHSCLIKICQQTGLKVEYGNYEAESDDVIDPGRSMTDLEMNIYRQNERQFYINYLAESKGGIIIKCRTKEHHEYIRDYCKSESPDLLPFASLRLRNIYNLAAEFNLIEKHNIDQSLQKEAGSGITYLEMEWLDELNKNTGLITNLDDPAKTKNWFKHTSRQKEIICRLHQIEKMTRSKYNPAILVFEPITV